MNEDFPALPKTWDSSSLATMEGPALDAAASDLNTLERLMLTALAPYNQALKEVKARQAEVATELRRRERAARHAARKGVQAAAGTDAMPTLVAALGNETALFADDRALASIPSYLTSGGQVGFGFASKPGHVAFTNGREMEYAATFGRARELWQSGFELGTPQIPGVRVHLVGTLVERVVSGEDVIVRSHD